MNTKYDDEFPKAKSVVLGDGLFETGSRDDEINVADVLPPLDIKSPLKKGWFEGSGWATPDDEGEMKEANEEGDTPDEPTYWPMEGEDFEDVQEYIQGGFHPVHIGDIFNDRFEAVAKLDRGRYTTVWLCLDYETKKWRAIKVLAARYSYEDGPEMKAVKLLREKVGPQEWEAAHITLPLDQFWVEGPNGWHLCFVLPVLGPRLQVDHNDPATAQKLLLNSEAPSSALKSSRLDLPLSAP
ncbi:hypothetical protein F4779DRAFT_616821 [Xylariaceae sp. FL0662B]|nr:hypothetical protein F4779DRAFT_616821 [Xylariaceae sp. FL0662B]